MSIILDWIKNKREPSTQELFLISPAVKHLWSCRKQFTWENGVLYYTWVGSDNKQLLVLPTCLKEEVLHYCHDNKVAGHLGREKTILKVKQRYIWHGLTKDCILYVTSCSVCNKNKTPNVKAKAALGSYHAGAPMERVHIDILGPLPTTEQNNKYILVTVDQFTKWMECYPIKDQKAETVAKVLASEFISRFG